MTKTKDLAALRRLARATALAPAPVSLTATARGRSLTAPAPTPAPDDSLSTVGMIRRRVFQVVRPATADLTGTLSLPVGEVEIQGGLGAVPAEPAGAPTFTMSPGEGRGGGVIKAQPRVYAVDFAGLDLSADGLIWEAGANLLGAAVYVEAGALKLRHQDDPAPATEIATTIPSGDGRLVWRIADGTGLQIWWNDVLLDQVAGAIPNVGGTGNETFLTASGDIVAGAVGATAFSSFDTVSDLRVY